jgi:hypothetical protein
MKSEDKYRVEPNSPTWEASIAISLKRIADAMEQKQNDAETIQRNINIIAGK